MTEIRTINLSKTYKKDNFKALDNLNLEISKNSIFGFLGPNGAGKTTTLKLLTGLIEPTKGEIWIGNTLVKSANSINNKIGYLSQSPYYYDWMSAKELLNFVGALFNMSKKESSIRTQELLELCGLSNHKDRKIGTYSGGMIQRLGIAQALMNHPQVLFLDEPVSDMDPLGRKEILDFIQTLKDQITVFMSSHILEDVERVCDSVAIINKGQLIKVSDMEKLKMEYGYSSKTISIEFSSIKDAELSKYWLKKYPSNFYSISDNKITILHNEFDNIKNEFFHWISTSSINIESYNTNKPSLEDIFVSIIKGEEKNEQNTISSII